MEALRRDFFKGKRVYVSEMSIEYTVVFEPALTEREIHERMTDPSFCQKCFRGEFIHYFDCPLSPWNADGPLH